MKDQHKHIAGYRDLTAEEIAVINALKDGEAHMGTVLAEVEENLKKAGDNEAGRWVALARTHMEIGFMFAIKAVARPTNGLGRKGA